jgi:hypothetical protein
MFWDFREWNKLPFSYKKFVMECQVLCLVILFPTLTIVLANENIRFAGFVGLAATMLVVFVVGKMLLGPVWNASSQEFRNAIPFDTDQAAQGYGSIHSVRQIISRALGWKDA